MRTGKHPKESSIGFIQLSNTRFHASHKGKLLRVATYNVHKCRGLDGRVRPDRILKVLQEIDADVVALQEVVSAEGRTPEHDQARYLAEGLNAEMVLGENRRHKGGAYGNVLLSRFPIRQADNYDLSVSGRERRGCLRADLYPQDGEWLHIFNLHLGTSFFERRLQARRLFEQHNLMDGRLPGKKIILGDLNEWTKGLASRMFQSRFERVDLVTSPKRQTYPSFLPMLHLDHIYFDSGLELRSARVHRTRTALVASDHLPLVAEFMVSDEAGWSADEASSFDRSEPIILADAN